MNFLVEMKVINGLVLKEIKEFLDYHEICDKEEKPKIEGVLDGLVETYKYTIPSLMMDSMMFHLMIEPLTKIGREINKPVENKKEAIARLQEINNLLRPVIDFIDINVGHHDEKQFEEDVENTTPAVIYSHLEEIGSMIKDFMSDRPIIVNGNREHIKD